MKKRDEWKKLALEYLELVKRLKSRIECNEDCSVYHCKCGACDLIQEANEALAKNKLERIWRREEK